MVQDIQWHGFPVVVKSYLVTQIIDKQETKQVEAAH